MNVIVLIMFVRQSASQKQNMEYEFLEDSLMPLNFALCMCSTFIRTENDIRLVRRPTLEKW